MLLYSLPLPWSDKKSFDDGVRKQYITTGPHKIDQMVVSDLKKKKLSIISHCCICCLITTLYLHLLNFWNRHDRGPLYVLQKNRQIVCWTRLECPWYLIFFSDSINPVGNEKTLQSLAKSMQITVCSSSQFNYTRAKILGSKLINLYL